MQPRNVKADPPGTANPAPRTSWSGEFRATASAAECRGWRQWALAAAPVIAVLAIVLATYWPALSAAALYMDDKFYLGSPIIRHPSWASLRTIFGEVLSPSLVNGYYQPLSLLSMMLDFLDPTATSSLLPFHRTTLLLHLLNVALVIVLLHKLFGNWFTAALLGLLYGLHPLNADAVVWVAERKTVLGTAFALASLIAYVSYARHADHGGRRDWKRYLAALLLYVCALLSKPTTLPLLVLLPVLDYWPLDRLNRSTLLEKMPFLVVGVLSAAVTIISQANAGQDGTTHMIRIAYLPLLVAYGIAFYLVKVVYPAGLVSDYLYPKPLGLTNLEVLGSVLATVGILVAIIWSARRTRAWVVGGLFFFIATVPTLGLVRFTASIASNRSMYLPMVGLLLPLHWELNRAWSRSIGRLKKSSVRFIVVGLATTLAMGSAFATRRYEAHWQDSLTLLRYYLTQQPNDARLHTRLGNEWIQRGDHQAAITEFRAALRLNPVWAENWLNLGRASFTIGDYAEARQAFATALQYTPKDWRAHILMGTTLTRQADLEGALVAFRTATQLAPKVAVAHYNVANTLARQGKLKQAADEYQQTLRLDPRFEGARRALESIESEKPGLKRDF
jgi:protein O-mannosyl-transferase